MSAVPTLTTGVAIVDGVPQVALLLNGVFAYMGPQSAREMAESLFAWAKSVEAERRLLARTEKKS